MKKGIESGCLVMLTRATLPENVGKIATAVEVFKETTPHGRLWTIQFREPIKTIHQQVSETDIINGAIGATAVVQHPETWMKRIDGDDLLNMDDHFDALEDQQIAKHRVPA